MTYQAITDSGELADKELALLRRALKLELQTEGRPVMANDRCEPSPEGTGGSFNLAAVDAEMEESLARAEGDVADSAGLAPNSYSAGYDCGYRDAFRRALCILRGLDSND